MTTKMKQLPKLEPVKFPRSTGSSKTVSKSEVSVGKPTKVVIAEMKKLSKEDIYPTD